MYFLKESEVYMSLGHLGRGIVASGGSFLKRIPQHFNAHQLSIVSHNGGFLSSAKNYENISLTGSRPFCTQVVGVEDVFVFIKEENTTVLKEENTTVSNEEDTIVLKDKAAAFLDDLNKLGCCIGDLMVEYIENESGEITCASRQLPLKEHRGPICGFKYRVVLTDKFFYEYNVQLETRTLLDEDRNIFGTVIETKSPRGWLLDLEVKNYPKGQA